jgi:hypothetical protein
VGLIRSYVETRVMPEAEQLTEAHAQQFLLTTVWQGLRELADAINAESDRIATLTVDPAEGARVSLRVFPVGFQPAEAAPFFPYDVAVASTDSGVGVHFVTQPAVVNGQMRHQEREALTMTARRDRRLLTPDRIRDEVVRRYQTVMEAQTAPGGEH